MSAAQRLDEIFGLPRGSAVIVLNDPETKVPIAIMDGTLISAIRPRARRPSAFSARARSARRS